MRHVQARIHSQGPGSPPPQVPVCVSLPQIYGIGQVGQTLTATNGTWTGSPSSYAYKWNRNGTAISGATASTYTPVAPADANQPISVSVTATNGVGASLPATSSLPQFGIYQTNLGGTPTKMLVGHPTHELNHTRRSPDGAYLAYTEYFNVNQGSFAVETGDYTNTAIRLYRFSDGSIQTIAGPTVGVVQAGPSWFPDGRLIWTTSATPNGKHGVAIYDLGTQITSLYYNPSDHNTGDPEMNTAQNALVYTYGGNGYIWANGVRTQITAPSLLNGASGDTDAHWSPDGTQLTVARNGGPNNFYVVVVSVGPSPTFTNQGEVVIPVPHPTTALDGPAVWSRDGLKLILWHINLAARYYNAIYTVNPDGTGRTRIDLPSELSYTEPYFTWTGGSDSSVEFFVAGRSLPVFDLVPSNTSLPVITV